MELQEKVMKLDAVMRKLEEDVSPEKLESSGKWNKLVSMRQSLQKLLPQAHPEFSKRSTDFNGVQVWKFKTLVQILREAWLYILKKDSSLFLNHFNVKTKWEIFQIYIAARNSQL